MPALRTRDTVSRTLEVSTDAPQPPALQIISPTPRTFSFPTTHNLDSPFSSPCPSPFEADLRSLSSPQCTLPSSSITPPPQPPFPSQSDSPITQTPTSKRRKSSCSTDPIERRPKKGDEDYIKRPENAFILFRRKCCEDRQQLQDETAAAPEGPAKKQRQADLSKTISQQWKSLSAAERQMWEDLAKDKKKEHEKLYPNYVYRPQRAKDKDGRPKNGKKPKKFEFEDTESSVSFVVPIPRTSGQRSASMPTPPPFQSIQIPSVYQITPSCPTSPSLLPMISRRAAPGHEDALSSFDYVPNPSYVAPSFAMQSQSFEASLQSSEFMRNMYNAAGLHGSAAFPSLNTSMGGESLLLPAHQIVSPASSIGSGSSGPSSPATGPFTPTAAFPSDSATTFGTALSHVSDLEAQAQAEMQLQSEMQLQQEFASFTWGDSSLWGSDSAVLLSSDDFDINAIPPIELGMPKYTESLALAPSHSTGLDFGQEYMHSLEGRAFSDDGSQGMSHFGFEEMMASHGF